MPTIYFEVIISITCRWFAACISVVDVLAVRSRVRESLETFWTSEGFFPCMKSYVFCKVMLVLELFVAKAAKPGSFVCKVKKWFCLKMAPFVNLKAFNDYVMVTKSGHL